MVSEPISVENRFNMIGNHPTETSQNIFRIIISGDHEFLMCLKSTKNIGVIALHARGVITGEIWLLQAFFEAKTTKIWFQSQFVLKIASMSMVIEMIPQKRLKTFLGQFFWGTTSFLCLESTKNIGVIAHCARGVITGKSWLL